MLQHWNKLSKGIDMSNVAEKTNKHSSFIQSVNGSIASIALEKTGRAVAGALVTPLSGLLIIQ